MNKFKRVAAIIGIILILSLYVLSFVSAFFAKKYSGGLFAASVFSTIVIPIMIWWFVAVYKWVHRNDNSADFTADEPDHSNLGEDSIEVDSTVEDTMKEEKSNQE